MIQTMTPMYTYAVRVITTIWNRVPLHHQGKILTAFPILAIVFSTGTALVGNFQRANIESAMQRHVNMSQGFIRMRDYVAVFFTLAVGLAARLIAWYLFSRGVLRRIEHLAINTRSLGCGGPLPFPPSGKQDALGQLEQEIADLSGMPPLPHRSALPHQHHVIDDRPRSRDARHQGAQGVPTPEPTVVNPEPPGK